MSSWHFAVQCNHCGKPFKIAIYDSFIGFVKDEDQNEGTARVPHKVTTNLVWLYCSVKCKEADNG
jgi:hypothetical protein